MKQTKKLTYNQRSFLLSRGIKDFKNIRFYRENKDFFEYYNTLSKEIVRLVK